MNGCQDSGFERALAISCCRRTVLRALGGGLVGAALAGIGARAPLPARAQARSLETLPGPARAMDGYGLPLLVRSSSPRPALLVYDTAQGLLAGDLQHAVSMSRIQADLAAYPLDWYVVGVGSTNQPGRTGEMIPDGTAANLHFWWADPNSPSQADVTDLGQTSPSGDIEFPFLALGVAASSNPLTWAIENVPDVHSWLKDRLSSAGIMLAALRLQGTFGPVMTTVSYNIPPTGIDTSAVYVSAQNFHFGSYPSGTWNMTGVYAAAAALQPVISTTGNPLHLHGYQPGPMLGGHIVSAAPVSGIATIWVLDALIEQPAPLAPEATGSSS